MVGHGRFFAGCRLVGLMIAAGGLSPSALAESFHLKNGQVIDGVVLRATLNTLTLGSGSAVHLTSLSQIERVTLTLADGTELSGELVTWKDGVYEIRSADALLRVADGRLLDDETDTSTITASTNGDGDETLVDTVAMRSMPSFTLKEGKTLVGKILHATGSVMTIRPQGGTPVPVSKAQIETVRFEGENGEEISGKLLDWKDGIYRIQLDDRELLANLPDDAAAASAPVGRASDEEAPATPVTLVEEATKAPIGAEIEQVDAAALPATETGLTSDASSSDAGVGGPANETAVAALADVADNGADEVHRIEARVDAVDEGGQSVVFRFELSKPASRPLVVLYAATEASAKAGEDFEAKSGVITFATGSAYAEVQVPIIDDDLGEGSETFNLFLSGDPKSIQFADRQIAATINDDD